MSDLIDALTSAGLIESVEIDRFKPVVRLSDRGWTWVRGKDLSPPRLAIQDYLAEKVRNGGLERIPSGGPSPTGSLGEDDDGEPFSSGTSEDPADSVLRDDPLWERLRAVRLQLAREARLSPAYVFSNETLDALVRERPGNPSELARIKGIGPSKLERFGSALLEVIRAEPAPVTRQAVPPMPEAPTRHSESGGPGHSTGTEGQAHPFGDGPESDPDRAPSSPSTSSSKSSGSAGTLRRDPPSNNSTAEFSSSVAEATPSSRDVSPRKGAGPAPPVATEEWTWRLLDRGFNAEEAAAIRGLELAAIIRHATACARQGKPVPLSAFLPSEVVTQWEELQFSQGDRVDPARPAWTRLWGLFVACRSQRR